MMISLEIAVKLLLWYATIFIPYIHMVAVCMQFPVRSHACHWPYPVHTAVRTRLCAVMNESTACSIGYCAADAAMPVTLCIIAMGTVRRRYVTLCSDAGMHLTLCSDTVMRVTLCITASLHVTLCSDAMLHVTLCSDAVMHVTFLLCHACIRCDFFFTNIIAFSASFHSRNNVT